MVSSHCLESRPCPVAWIAMISHTTALAGPCAWKVYEEGPQEKTNFMVLTVETSRGGEGRGREGRPERREPMTLLSPLFPCRRDTD